MFLHLLSGLLLSHCIKVISEVLFLKLYNNSMNTTYLIYFNSIATGILLALNCIFWLVDDAGVTVTGVLVSLSQPQ